MFDFSGDVVLEDQFLRDGLQFERREFSVAEKLKFIEALEACGIRRIQVGSFVHPKWVPQMANTDEIFALLNRKAGVTYTALVLNMAGLDRAIAARVNHVSASISASETHSRKNFNKSIGEAQGQIRPILERALREGISVRAGIQSALGCGYEGAVPAERVINIAKLYSAIGVDEINIADTAGLANPRLVYELTSAVRDVVRSDTQLSLHLHDTRGLGLANMLAGLQAGVRLFDSAAGGLGGCPFIPAASGNISTEDAAFALEAMGFSTGVDWRALSAFARDLETVFKRTLSSRMARICQAA